MGYIIVEVYIKQLGASTIVFHHKTHCEMEGENLKNVIEQQ